MAETDRTQRERERKRAYYLANRERLILKQRAWYEANKEKSKAGSQRRQRTNPQAYARARKRHSEKLKGDPERLAKRISYLTTYRAEHPVPSAYFVKYRRDNRERRKEYNRTYVAARPGFLAAKERNRQQKKRASGGRITTTIGVLLLSEQGGLCAGCFGDLSQTGFHLDHVMPLALGGAHSDSNIQLLCPHCNLKKHAKHPADFFKEAFAHLFRNMESPP